MTLELLISILGMILNSLFGIEGIVLEQMVALSVVINNDLLHDVDEVVIDIGVAVFERD